ncbi:MAG: nitroreductase [Bdellovibrionales bacterium]|nr:nitroreductase [Bdellovibrionales bacterium]
MAVNEIILARRTIHDFKRDPVPDELVEEAIRLSLVAPNHKLTFPWHYFWPKGKVRVDLAELAVKIKQQSPGDPISPAMLERARNKFLAPPVLIALGLKKTENDFQAREDYATLACGVQNMALYLWEKGVGCKWSTGKPSRHEETYRLLKANPEEIELVGFLWVGYPEKIPPMMPRPELSQVLQVVE